MRGKQEQSFVEEIGHTPTPQTSSRKVGNWPLIIRNLPSHQKIIIAGRTIAVDSFVRRNYVFQDTQEKVNRRELRKALVFEDGNITVNGRLIQWNKQINIRNTSQLIKIGKENTITKRGFLKRTYKFKTIREMSDKKALRSTNIHDENGTATIDKNEIIRKKPYRRKNPFLFLKHYDVPEPVMGNEDEKDMATPLMPAKEHTGLFSDSHDAPEDLENDEFFRVFMLQSLRDDYPLFPNLDSMASPLESMYGEDDGIQTAELNEIELQTRKLYSPTFFPTLEKSRMVSSNLECNGSLRDKAEYDRNEITPL